MKSNPRKRCVLLDCIDETLKSEATGGLKWGDTLSSEVRSCGCAGLSVEETEELVVVVVVVGVVGVVVVVVVVREGGSEAEVPRGEGGDVEVGVTASLFVF